MAPLPKIIMILTLLSVVLCEQREGDFILELSPATDNKKIKPFNITIPTNNTFQHQITVNNVNFRRNVTLGLTLYVWYNGDWVNKKSRLLQITDKRNVISENDNLLMNLAKTRIRKTAVVRNQLLLNSAQIYISHDPQGSLNSATLEDPALFIPNNRYTLVDLIHKNVTKVDVKLVFKVVPKSDAFIENRRHLVELAEIRKKVEENVPLLGQPVDTKNFEPLHIWGWIKRNINSLGAQQKKITEKLDLMQRYNLRSLIAPGIKKLQLSSTCPQLQNYLKQYQMTYNENAPLVWKWILHQQVMKSRIDSLASVILSKPEEITEKDAIIEATKSSQNEECIGMVIGGLWVLLDLISYWFIKKNIGISRSYGTFLNFWLILQLVSWSFRVGLSLNGYAGLALLFIGLLLHGLISIPFENRFDSEPHKGSRFDEIATSFMKTLIFLVVLFNIVYNAYGGASITMNSFLREGFEVLKKSRSQVFILVPWAFSELGFLLNEYYYVLVVMPQIMLNFRLRNVEKGTLIRVILLGAILWSKSHTICGSCDVSMLLGMKEGVLGLILLLQWFIFRRGKVVSTHVDLHVQDEEKVPLSEPEESAPKRQQEKKTSTKQKNKQKKA